MCEICSAEVAYLKVRPETSVRLTKEERSLLPGKSHGSRKVSELNEEELQERRQYRRAYERLYRAKRNENDSSLKQYQDAYHKAYQRNHKQQLRDYLTDYRKNKNPEWARTMYRRRRARKHLADSVIYTTNQILNTWGTACYLCGEEIDIEAPRRVGVPGWQEGLHLDHVIPLALGGTDTPDNVKPVHGQCNLRKSVSVVQELGDDEERVKVLFKELYGDPSKGRPLTDN